MDSETGTSEPASSRSDLDEWSTGKLEHVTEPAIGLRWSENMNIGLTSAHAPAAVSGSIGVVLAAVATIAALGMCTSWCMPTGRPNAGMPERDELARARFQPSWVGGKGEGEEMTGAASAPPSVLQTWPLLSYITVYVLVSRVDWPTLRSSRAWPG